MQRRLLRLASVGTTVLPHRYGGNPGRPGSDRLLDLCCPLSSSETKGPAHPTGCVSQTATPPAAAMATPPPPAQSVAGRIPSPTSVPSVPAPNTTRSKSCVPVPPLLPNAAPSWGTGDAAHPPHPRVPQCNNMTAYNADLQCRWVDPLQQCVDSSAPLRPFFLALVLLHPHGHATLHRYLRGLQASVLPAPTFYPPKCATATPKPAPPANGTTAPASASRAVDAVPPPGLSP